jgi:hypothetical protein
MCVAVLASLMFVFTSAIARAQDDGPVPRPAQISQQG